LNAVFTIAFWKNINITTLSIAPIATIIVGIIMALVLKSAASDSTMNDTAYNTSSISLADNETMERNKYMSYSVLMGIPLQIPFVLFFSGGVKLLTIIVFVLSLIVGGVVFKMRRGKSITTRASQISSELEEQKKKEEMGKF
jgi:hypothetical protein